MEKRRLYKEQQEDTGKPQVPLIDQFNKLNELMKTIDQHIKDIEDESSRNNRE